MNTPLPAGPSPADVPEHRGFYRMLWLIGVGITLVMLEIAWASWDTSLLEELGVRFDGGPTTLLFVAAYLALSIKMVRADEIAGAFFYGKALVRLDPGLHFLPFGLMQIAKVPRKVQEFQAPGEPEQVQKGDDKIPLEPGKVRPIRAVTRAPTKDETEILDTQMTLDLNFVIQYAITDIFDNVANFGSAAEIERQLRDVGETTLGEEVTRNTPNTFIKNLARVNETLVLATRERFEHSGVNIISVRLISPDVSHDVSTELANVPKARAKAQQTVITAESEKTKRIKEGEGVAAAELALLNARAEGQKKLKDSLGVSGDTVVASEAVRGLSEKTDVIVVGAEGGMRDVMGLVKGAESALGTSRIFRGDKP